MTNDAAVAWNVLEIGNRGAAYDLPWVKRAFTYDHQPGNVDASKLGRAANTAVHMSAGDSIDRGLALLRTLQDEGFGVFQIGPEVAQDATTVAELRAEVAYYKENFLSCMATLNAINDAITEADEEGRGFVPVHQLTAALTKESQ